MWKGGDPGINDATALVQYIVPLAIRSSTTLHSSDSAFSS